jgi:hypothetical protein
MGKLTRSTDRQSEAASGGGGGRASSGRLLGKGKGPVRARIKRAGGEGAGRASYWMEAHRRWQIAAAGGQREEEATGEEARVRPGKRKQRV